MRCWRSLTKIDSLLIIYIIIGVLPVSAQTRSLAEEISLNGNWEIIFDQHNKGKAGEWHINQNFSRQSTIREISVPSCWEEIEQDYEGVAFYRCSFHVPEDWADRSIELSFEAVNYVTEVWLNDQVVGFHEGGFTPFDFEVAGLLFPGKKNTLTLRVVGPILLTDQEIDGMGQMEVPQWRGAITGGVWQGVSLRSSGYIGIKDVYLEPQITDPSVSITLEVINSTNELQPCILVYTILDHSGAELVSTKLEQELQPGTTSKSILLDIPDARLWSPDDPYLYSCQVRIQNLGSESDSWMSNFGLREFTIRDKQFVLNGEPLYLKACFFEGLYPVKLAYPDSREMAIREIQLAKDAGFNMIRPWRKPPPPMWLDLCDEMGMLTIGSLVVECMERPIATPYLPSRVEHELRSSLIRDRNRTCVVMWELFNELHQPILIQLLQPMSQLARKLDPSRLILDESGGWAKGAKMYLPYQNEGIPFNDVHDYAGSQITEDRFNGYLLIGKTKEEILKADFGRIKIPGRNLKPGEMTFVSELGYGSLPDLVQNNQQFKKTGNPLVSPTRYHKRIAEETLNALEITGFDQVYPNLTDFIVEQQKQHGYANKRLIEAIRCNPAISGYCVHALVAGDWVLGAGIIDLWRNPKNEVYKKTQEANQDRIVVLQASPRNVYAERGTQLMVTIINDAAPINAFISILINDEQDSVVFSKNMDIELKKGINQIYTEKFETSSLIGNYKFSAHVKGQSGNLISENELCFDVFHQQDHDEVRPFSIVDPKEQLVPFLSKRGIQASTFSPNQNTAMPVLVGALNPKRNEDINQIKQIEEFVRKGGKAIFLEVPGKKLPWFHGPLPDSPIKAKPMEVMLINSLGLWAGRPHIVKKHPIFDGLPVNTIMSGVYENIHPIQSMVKLEGEYQCGVITYEHFPELDKMKRHYNGPGNVWWGADLSITPMGEGLLLLSTLLIINNFYST